MDTAGDALHNRFRWRVTFLTNMDGSLGFVSAPMETTVQHLTNR